MAAAPQNNRLIRAVGRRTGSSPETGFWEMMTEVPDRLSAARKLATMPQSLHNKARCELRAGHGVGGGHHAVGKGEVGFADGAIDFVGAGGGFETVGEEEALEGDARGPDIFEGDDVFGLEVEKFALGLQDSRI